MPQSVAFLEIRTMTDRKRRGKTRMLYFQVPRVASLVHHPKGCHTWEMGNIMTSLVHKLLPGTRGTGFSPEDRHTACKDWIGTRRMSTLARWDE